MSSGGGGEAGEVVKIPVRIKETPASSASVAAPPSLAYLALSNNRAGGLGEWKNALYYKKLCGDHGDVG